MFRLRILSLQKKHIVHTSLLCKIPHGEAGIQLRGKTLWLGSYRYFDAEQEHLVQI